MRYQSRQHVEHGSDIWRPVDEAASQALANRIEELLRSESSVPAVSQGAVKLCALAQDESSSMEDFVQIVALDSGLAARCLSVASSIGFHGRPIENIQQALMIIGVREMRRIAFTVAIIGAFSGFSARIDWRKFWFHNVLVARLTESIAKLYRQVNGMEYLAGLLHDIGKVMIEHYFPKEFERIIVRAMERRCGHSEIERAILGIDHAQIGAAMCQRMQIHPDILQAIRFHHDPLSADPGPDPRSNHGFLATCICAADQVANKTSLLRKEDEHPVFLLDYAPKGSCLEQKENARRFQLDVDQEIGRTREDLARLL